MICNHQARKQNHNLCSNQSRTARTSSVTTSFLNFCLCFQLRANYVPLSNHVELQVCVSPSPVSKCQNLSSGPSLFPQHRFQTSQSAFEPLPNASNHDRLPCYNNLWIGSLPLFSSRWSCSFAEFSLRSLQDPMAADPSLRPGAEPSEAPCLADGACGVCANVVR